MNISRMKIQRTKKGLTQKDLRVQTQTGLTTLVKIEKGNIDGVRVRTLRKIAQALDSNISDLFFSEDN